MNKAVLPILILALAFTPSAFAKTYKCVDAKGKVYYSQTPTPECMGQETQELNKRGIVTKTNKAPTTEEEQKAREEAAAQAREEALKEREQKRRDKALLATYASEQEIDAARDRNLQSAEAFVKSYETRLKAVEAREAGYVKQRDELTAKKAAVPPSLTEDIHAAAAEKEKLNAAISQKKKEMDQIRAKYDGEKKRFTELKQAGN